MKMSKMLCAVLAAAMLAGCAANTEDNETAEEVLQSPTAMTTTTAESEVQTSAEITTEQTKTTEPTEITAEETTVTEAEEWKGLLVEVSAGNEFIDYKFIENYEGTKDIGELSEKAVEFLMTTEEYENAMSEFDKIDEEFGEPYITDGKLIPQFEQAYPDDYDGDGSTETFITLAMPVRESFNILNRFFIFADSSGNMTLLDNVNGVYDTIFLDYGSFKQITFGGCGSCGAADHIVLYGVDDGNVTKLYGGRGHFYKQDCFLSFFGWQSSGSFMYFDTVRKQYISIDSSVGISADELREMDTTGVLGEIFWGAQLFGGKYYCIVQGVMDSGEIYTYENNTFTYVEDSKIRTQHDEGRDYVIDIDIDEAVASMKHID